MKKISRTGSRKQIDEFFRDIGSKTPLEIRKIKRLAMSHNIPLKEKRKKFCKKCFFPYKNPGTRVKNKIKSVKCKNCGYISRWKL